MNKKELERIKVINHLIKSDKKLGEFIQYFEKEDFVIQDDYKKKSDFLSMVRIIIGQQLSISAASSIYDKFTNKFGEEIKKIKFFNFCNFTFLKNFHSCNISCICNI